MLPDDAGSDICLMAACRNKDTHRNSIAAIIHISTAEFQNNGSPSLRRRRTRTWLVTPEKQCQYPRSAVPTTH